MPNVIVWFHRATEDRRHKFSRDKLVDVARGLVALERRRELFFQVMRASDEVVRPGEDPKYPNYDTLMKALREAAGEGAGGGLAEDAKVEFKAREGPAGNLREAFEKLDEWLWQQQDGTETYEEFVEEAKVGSNGPIAALRGAYLAYPDHPGQGLPQVYYLGLLPATVVEVLKVTKVDLVTGARRREYPNPVVERSFRHAAQITRGAGMQDERPITVSLEDDHAKLMINYAPASRWSELLGVTVPADVAAAARRVAVANPRDDRLRGEAEQRVRELEEAARRAAAKRVRNAPARPERLVERMEGLVTEAGQHGAVDRIVVALGVPSDAMEQAVVKGFLRAVRAAFPPYRDGDLPRVIVFACTSDLKGTDKLTEEPKAKVALEFLDEIRPDILSANESEVEELHKARVGGYRTQSLASKLRELGLAKIHVCHRTSGVALDLGSCPDEVISSEDFVRDPDVFVEEAVRLAVDGATCAVGTLEGRTASDAAVRAYSRLTRDEARHVDQFRYEFVGINGIMPAGMVGVASPYVAKQLGAVTGAGAIFDSLLLCYLMRD